MFAGVFDDVFSSTEIGALKPSADYFTSVLSSLASQGIIPSEIAYFDDSQRNVEAARVVGIASYLYRNVSAVKNWYLANKHNGKW